MQRMSLATQVQVIEIFAYNGVLVMTKTAQGSDGLELVPAAMPILLLIDKMNASIAKKVAEGTILQTIRSLF
jgi:hypothetical protein